MRNKKSWSRSKSTRLQLKVEREWQTITQPEPNLDDLDHGPFWAGILSFKKFS